MTERQGTVEGQTQGGQEPQWRVEGSESSQDGLGDTVVRLPKITDDGPAPTLPPPPRQRPNRNGRGSAPVKPEAPADRKPASRPKDAQPKDAEATTSLKAPTPFAAPSPSRVPTPPPPPFSTLSYPATVEPTAAVPAAAVATPVSAGAVSGASPAPAPKSSGLRRTRKARLRLSRVDPWSVMKTSFLFSIAFGIMFWVAVSVVWTVLVSSGLFDVINQSIQNVLSSPNSTTTWRIEDYVNANKVLGIAALLAVINVVISTALGTLGAFLYNLSANILGGLELTLAED